MLIAMESKRSSQEIEKMFAEAAGRHKFGVLGMYNLRQKLNEKGIPFERDCRVFEICNPQLAGKVLGAKMAMATALPCRIAVYEEEGKTKLATLKPSGLVAMFQTPELQPVAEEVEQAIVRIMEELAG
jgi:uncharacterized protein (DUF302 family)